MYLYRGYPGGHEFQHHLIRKVAFMIERFTLDFFWYMPLNLFKPLLPPRSQKIWRKTKNGWDPLPHRTNRHLRHESPHLRSFDRPWSLRGTPRGGDRPASEEIVHACHGRAPGCHRKKSAIFVYIFGKEPKFNIEEIQREGFICRHTWKFSHCVHYRSLLLTEEIPNNHLGCRKHM